MSANELLSLLMHLLFIFLGVVTLIEYIRHRDKTRRDIALMFGSLATLYVLQDIVRITGIESQLLSTLAICALVAQPYLLLRLVLYFRPVPTLLIRIAGISMVVSWIAFALAKSFSPAGAVIALLAIILYFVAIDGYAAVSFVRGAFTTAGVVRQRLRFAAAGSGLLALALFSLGLGGIIPGLREFATLLVGFAAIGSALSFYIGFAPPRWVRRAWQLAELRKFLMQINTKPIGERLNIVNSQQELCLGAKRAVGGMIATIAQEADTENGWVLGIENDRPELVNHFIDNNGIFKRVWHDRTSVSLRLVDGLKEDERQLLTNFGAETLLIAPLATTDRVWGLLLVFVRNNSLFLQDDLELATLLAQQSAIVLENSSLIKELHHYSGQLEKRVEERTKELQESQKEYRRIIETAQEGIWVTNAEYKTTFANPRLAEMLGYTVAELLAASPLTVIDPDSIASTMIHRERRQQGIKEQYEFKLRRKDGSDLWALISTTPLTDDKEQYLGVLAMLADITDRKQAEDNILKLNTELEQRVVERTMQLEVANRELEAFSYSVSHDLRTPLRAIDGFSQALLEDYSEQLDKEGQSYLQRVRAATQRMAELIDDLLELSRVTRSDMRQENVNLTTLAQQIMDALQKQDGKRQVDFTIAKDLTAVGDPHLLRVALENLLGNAWKFTEKQSEAHVELGSIVQPDGQTAYFVCDNGAGFDMNYAGKLFGAFQRLHAANDFPGTGIGLATVQRIIHRHGGKIWAEGAVNQGATFYFTL
jgi:PAS domain S-box-containing protein